MKKKSDFLYKIIEDKTIVWFKNNNEYLVLENTTADILKRLSKGVSVKEIAFSLSKKLAIPLGKAIDFIIDLEKRIYELKTNEYVGIINDYRDIKKPKKNAFTKFYKINSIIFKVTFSNEYLELSFVHPKFGHLEIDTKENYQHEFSVFTNNSFIFLKVNNKLIGAWSRNEIHYFQGKFSMELIQKIHQKEENEWLGVFFMHLQLVMVKNPFYF